MGDGDVDEETFKDLVRADMFGEPVELLRTVEVIDRWIAALVTIINEINDQFSTAKVEDELLKARSIAGEMSRIEYGEELARRNKWRRAAKAFQRRADARLKDAKALRARLNSERVKQANSDGRRRYRDAIKRHRVTVLAAGIEPAEHDRVLWAILDKPTENLIE